MAEHINNFLKYIEKVRYRGKCEECDDHFPNKRTTVKTRGAMHSWKKRHQEKTGHVVLTSVTYVRRYPPKE